MDVCCIILIVLLVLLIVGFIVILWKLRQITKPLHAPEINDNEYWGTQGIPSKNDNKSIKPAQIEYNENEINALTLKLSESIPFHPALIGIEEEYGINTNTLTDFIKYWRDNYLPKWHTVHQPFLNSVPHFETEIQG